jgi:hypothetical protein
LGLAVSLAVFLAIFAAGASLRAQDVFGTVHDLVEACHARRSGDFSRASGLSKRVDSKVLTLSFKPAANFNQSSSP